ncbi:hypothetical protein JKP88DRAFT_284889 [Tribonema minus]|uniref:Uncharacterized protein n=1 Tax=Tribonema minus TaxID=303371 RepID=A0A835ZJ49_9STRA|nr:hypothetical protein JKP88DRAFT_284889 [Tribonema minus]
MRLRQLLSSSSSRRLLARMVRTRLRQLFSSTGGHILARMARPRSQQLAAAAQQHRQAHLGASALAAAARQQQQRTPLGTHGSQQLLSRGSEQSSASMACPRLQ